MLIRFDSLSSTFCLRYKLLRTVVYRNQPNLLEKIVLENNASPSEATRDVATAVWFILARLVIVPVIAYPIFSVINLPGGRMTTLIILLELAMPGAQTVLVTLNAVGSGHVAEEIAPWYFLQYGTAIITLTAFTVWALHIVYR